ncbi:hypothetical protein BDA99DRAFT_503136, partial [Phascolomyces articulosus]
MIRCFELFQTNSFPKLRTLDIRYYPESQEHYNLLCSALTNLSGPLKSLKISTGTLDMITPNVSLLLTLCRNLTSLRLESNGGNCVFAPYTVPFTTNLTKIELVTLAEKICGTELQKLFQSSPNLRWVSIQRCANSDFYDLVQKYCPNVEVLIGGHIRKTTFESDKWLTDITPNNELQVVSVGTHAIGTGLISFLEKNRIRLRALSLNQKDATITSLSNADMRHLSMIDFSNLAHFHLFGVP